jgi:hypothetical protein
MATRAFSGLTDSLGKPLDESMLKKLTDEELDQLEKLWRKMGPRDNPAEGDTDTEMLAKVSRHEASLANMVTKTLSLLHAIQMARTASKEDRRIIDATPPKKPISSLVSEC